MFDDNSRSTAASIVHTISDLLLSASSLVAHQHGVLDPVEGMARAIRIEELLLHNASPPERERSRQVAATGRKHASTVLPTSRPELAVNTSARLVHAKSPILNRSARELDKTEFSAVRHRKRKSPIEGDVFQPTRPVRLPRFSVNIFHAEPANVFPIPNEGVVPRMVKYCKPGRPSTPFLFRLICASRSPSLVGTTRPSACLRGSSETVPVFGIPVRSATWGSVRSDGRTQPCIMAFDRAHPMDPGHCIYVSSGERLCRTAFETDVGKNVCG